MRDSYTQNPFEGLRVRLPAALESRGFRHEFVDVGEGVVLSYVRGPANGVPLVLLPAQMGMWQTYERVAVELCDRFEIFAVDITGHGSSSWTPGAYTWDTIGGQLRVLLDTVVGAPAIVSGNSSGGVLALWLAAHAPSNVAAVVLEDAPIFSVEWPRFRDRDRFVYAGLKHAVTVLEKHDRHLADYFRGQVLPVSPTRTKRLPDWAVDLIDRGVQRWERSHPGQPSGFAAWWAPASFGDLFRSLSMFDPDFARAFVDGRMYGDFSHSEALRSVRVPILVMHARWMRVEPYGLVGALDDDDVKRIRVLAPQTRVERFDVNHVVHRYDRAGFVRAIRQFADQL